MLPIQKCEFNIGNTSVLILMQGGFSKERRVGEAVPHNHPNVEVHYVESGSVCFFSGENRLTLGKDTLVIIPPRFYHAFENQDGATRISFEIKLSRAKGGSETFEEYDRIFNSLTEPQMLSRLLPEFISLSECTGLIKSEEQFCRARANFMLSFLTVADLLRSRISVSHGIADQSPALIPASDENITVIRILNYISTSFHLPISLGDVAREVNLSERQVQRILADRMHEGFHTLLTKQRINNARILLSSGEEKRPLEEIAYACGFSSYVSFWSHFKRATGESPDEFRKKRR